MTPCGYDAYMAAVNAIEKAGSTEGTAIRDALAALEVKGLVTGDLKFDENGDAVKTYAVIKTIKKMARSCTTAPTTADPLPRHKTDTQELHREGQAPSRCGALEKTISGLTAPGILFGISPRTLPCCCQLPVPSRQPERKH